MHKNTFRVKRQNHYIGLLAVIEVNYLDFIEDNNEYIQKILIMFLPNLSYISFNEAL